MKIIRKFYELPVGRKIQIVAALVLTIAVFVAVPVRAWLMAQRKAAELYKIQYPNSLFLNAAHREDRIYFGLDGINVNAYKMDAEGNIVKDLNGDPIKITKQYYVFTVSGSNTKKFTLQMAHTNNNQFHYQIYEATQYDYLNSDSVPEGTAVSRIVPAGTNSERVVTYTQHAGSHTENMMQVIGDEYVDGEITDKYYVRSDTAVNGEYKNVVSGTYPAKKDTGDTYYIATYGNNTNVETYAVPSYWQAQITLANSEIDANKQFSKYFILEVSWGENQEQGSKETDMIYFSVERDGGWNKRSVLMGKGGHCICGTKSRHFSESSGFLCGLFWQSEY